MNKSNAIILLLGVSLSFVSPAYAQTDNKASGDVIVDAQPTFRVPPIIPPRATSSGYCCMDFNISATGSTVDIEASHCSDAVFKEPSLNAVSKWKYSPKTINGVPTKRTGIHNLVSYHLSYSDGTLLRSSDGFPMMYWSGKRWKPMHGLDNKKLFCDGRQVS